MSYSSEALTQVDTVDEEFSDKGKESSFKQGVAHVANCMCCELYVLGIAHVANCMCCELHMLQIACVANCTCCKLHALQIAHVVKVQSLVSFYEGKLYIEENQ